MKNTFVKVSKCAVAILLLAKISNAQITDGVTVPGCSNVQIVTGTGARFNHINRTNCLFYKKNEEALNWKFTSPATGLTFSKTVAYGNKVTISWTPHPNPNAKYVLEIYSATADGEIDKLYYCKEMGSNTSTEITNCSKSGLGSITVRLIAYTDVLYDDSGREIDRGRFYLCDRTAELILIPHALDAPAVSPQVVCGKGPHTISVPPSNVSGSNVNVAWYDNPSDPDDSYDHTGYSWNREFNDPVTILYIAYFIETDCGKQYGPRSSYTITRQPPLPVASPIAQEELVFCSDDQTITAPPYPDPSQSANVAWYYKYSDNEYQHAHTGYSWTRDFPDYATTVWMAYFIDDPCNGTVYGSKSPFTVIRYDLISPPSPKNETLLGGENDYTLYVPPSDIDPEFQVRWYGPNGSYLYTGNAYQVHLTMGVHEFLITYYDESCSKESTKSTYTVLVAAGGYPVPCDPVYSASSTACKKVTAVPGEVYTLATSDVEILPDQLPDGDLFYEWFPSDGLSNKNIARPNIHYDDIPVDPQNEIIYQLYIVSKSTEQRVEEGCTAIYKCGELSSANRPSYTGEFYNNDINKILSVYPNPANDVLSVKLNMVNSSNSVLTIHDELGRVVQQVKLPQNQDSINFDIGLYPKGIYLLTLRTNEGITAEKIVIM